MVLDAKLTSVLTWSYNVCLYVGHVALFVLVENNAYNWSKFD